MEFPREEDIVQPLKFFKIIRRESLKDKKLMIPREFVRQCGRDLKGKATLLAPDGLRWDMKIVKDDGDDRNLKFWFKNGWQAFAEYYSLSHGEFISFQYNGGRNTSSLEFSITIFDEKAEKERDYPSME